MPHVVLFGDSIFDNRAYTGREPDVITHLHGLLQPSWRATLLAVDGATTGSIPAQVRRAPADVTHAIVSVGGNDALGNMDLLGTPTRSTADALALFRRRAGAFETQYRQAIDLVASLKCPLTLCTIYNGNLPEEQAALARVALMIFNDAILRTAFERGAGVIDLRLVCNQPSDYANPIEPSGSGGLKIANAIARAAGAIPGGATSLVWK
jgi:GDSL-like Lipase/Acylhydrolase family